MQTLLALNQQTPLQKNFNLLTEPSQPVEYDPSSSVISLSTNVPNEEQPSTSGEA